MITWRRTVATLVLTVTPSCVFSAQHARPARNFGAALSGVAVVGGAIASTVESEDDRIGVYSVLGMLGGLGLALVIAGQVQIEEAPAGATEVEPVDDRASPDIRNYRRAVVLTRSAAVAAGKDDCATVAKLGGDVIALGGDLYNVMFIVDPSVQRCLGPAPGGR